MPLPLSASRTVGAASTLALPPGMIYFFAFSAWVKLMCSRLAIELGLNRDSKVQPLDERHERELLNRRRTWVICSIMDGSASLESGNAPGVGKDEEVHRFPFVALQSS